jgi:hypothetical protein
MKDLDVMEHAAVEHEIERLARQIERKDVPFDELNLDARLALLVARHGEGGRRDVDGRDLAAAARHENRVHAVAAAQFEHALRAEPGAVEQRDEGAHRAGALPLEPLDEFLLPSGVDRLPALGFLVQRRHQRAQGGAGADGR